MMTLWGEYEGMRGFENSISGTTTEAGIKYFLKNLNPKSAQTIRPEVSVRTTSTLAA
jgi:hypothetical protein